MAKLFDLEASGYFYTRLQNPTNDYVAMGLDIINVIYRTDGEHNEIVTLFYESGYTVVKDVTADSLLALVRDVIKGL